MLQKKSFDESSKTSTDAFNHLSEEKFSKYLREQGFIFYDKGNSRTSRQSNMLLQNCGS